MLNVLLTPKNFAKEKNDLNQEQPKNNKTRMMNNECYGSEQTFNASFWYLTVFDLIVTDRFTRQKVQACCLLPWFQRCYPDIYQEHTEIQRSWS